MGGATRFSNSNNGGPYLIQNFPGVFGSDPVNGTFLNREQCHQM